MRELRQRECFLHEVLVRRAPHLFAVGDLMEHLEADVAAQPLVVSPIHHAHAAPGDDPVHAIPAEQNLCKQSEGIRLHALSRKPPEGIQSLGMCDLVKPMGRARETPYLSARGGAHRKPTCMSARALPCAP